MSFEELQQYYIIEQHTQQECCQYFHIGRTKLQKIIKEYGLNKNSTEIAATRCRTNMEKYGCAYVSQNDDIKAKVRQTCVEKYGISSTLQLDSVKQLGKITSRQKYGTDHPSQSMVVRAKTRQSNLDKYGVDNVSKINSVKLKKSATTREHYGVENPSQADAIKERKKETFLQKYGVECNLQDPKTIQLIKQIIFDKYGTLHPPVAKYYFDGEYFDSSWELCLWIYANDHGYEIERCPCKITYEYNNELHYTVPDFKYRGMLLELKGDQFMCGDQMINPYDRSQDGLYNAKRLAALNAGVNFWYQKEMEPILDYIKHTYSMAYLEQYKINTTKGVK